MLLNKKIIRVLVLSIFVMCIGCGLWYVQHRDEVAQPYHYPLGVHEKIYRDITLNISFAYPKEWKKKGGDILTGAYFTNQKGIEVLEVGVDDNFHGEVLLDYVTKGIKQRNCQGESQRDHVIRATDTSVLYVEYCSATSETYIYKYLTRSDKLIMMSYHDNFTESATEEKKIEIFEGIIKSISE